MATYKRTVYSIAEFIRLSDRSQLVLQPKFQRRKAWQDAARSYLIDTIVKEMPMPKVYLRRIIHEETNLEAFEVVDGVNVYRLPIQRSKQEGFGRQLIEYLRFMIMAFIKLVQLYHQKRYKVVQVHNLPDYLIFVGILHKLFGVKLILDIHDPSVDLFEEKWPGKKNKIFKYFIKIGERYSCKLSDHLITVTSMCKEKLVERGNPSNKITLILNTAVCFAPRSGHLA